MHMESRVTFHTPQNLFLSFTAKHICCILLNNLSRCRLVLKQLIKLPDTISAAF